jgi:hypothetical protein
MSPALRCELDLKDWIEAQHLAVTAQGMAPRSTPSSGCIEGYFLGHEKPALLPSRHSIQLMTECAPSLNVDGDCEACTC